jgi:hypothetical protein
MPASHLIRIQIVVVDAVTSHDQDGAGIAQPRYGGWKGCCSSSPRPTVIGVSDSAVERIIQAHRCQLPVGATGIIIGD